MRAFLFYIDDWLSSKAIAIMDAAEERGYLRLLLAAAGEPDCGLPDDDAELAILSLLGDQWGKPTADKSKRLGSMTSGEKLRRSFVARDGRLFNERLLKEFNHQLEVKASRAKAGQKGGRAKASARQSVGSWLANAKQLPEVATDVLKQKPTNSSLGLGLGVSEEKENIPSAPSVKSSQAEFDYEAGFAEFSRGFPYQRGVYPAQSLYWQLLNESGDAAGSHARLVAAVQRHRKSKVWHAGKIHNLDNFLALHAEQDSPEPCACGLDDPLKCPVKGRTPDGNSSGNNTRGDRRREEILGRKPSESASSATSRGPAASRLEVITGGSSQ